MHKNIALSITPILVVCIALSFLLIIPLKIIGYGFLPPDDALRHAAKAVPGKSWNEILVVRDEIKMDSHPGWHAILGFVHKLTGWDQEGLVVFSVVVLSLSFLLIPIFFFAFPESWLLSLFIITMTNASFIRRLFAGRPYMLTMSVVLLLCFLWPKLRDKKSAYKTMLSIIFLIALSTWIHGTWFLFALPVACLLLAREWRAGLRMGIAALIGILLGAIFSGHPYLFLKQNIVQLFITLGYCANQRVLPYEFQPFTGDALTVIFVCGVLAWRHMRGAWDTKRIDNPVFILAITGWALGFFVKRFWLDWGMPALCFWLAEEFQEVFKKTRNTSSFLRIIPTLALGAVLYLSFTSDANYHWTDNLTIEYLRQTDPEQATLLPEAGGIIYTDDMTIFYQTFFKNPRAPWRYILGFDPTWMPAEDLAIFRKIQKGFGREGTFDPWVRKMRPQDRLIIRRSRYDPPTIPGLEWYYATNKIWIGRLPRQ
jgi:hypothetical protein